MNRRLKTLLRTIQVNCPLLLDTKFALMRHYRRARQIPFDPDFSGIRLFPVSAGNLFLDVGSNRGQSADAILLMTGDTYIHLFEPNPLMCQKLRRLFAQNERVVIYEFGLGNPSRSRCCMSHSINAGCSTGWRRSIAKRPAAG